MNYCAFEILCIIEECEDIDHPEMIPSPQKIRHDPEFAEALDWLLEKGYVEICESRHSSHYDEDLAIQCGFFHPGTESLTITPTGTAVLEEDSKHRVKLNWCQTRCQTPI
jgi:hypothetical protein